MGKIVFSDVDGTLLNSEHKMTALTERAVKELKKKGIPFAIVSGRGPTGIYPILEEYGFNCPIISYSGALILDEGRNVLFNKGMTKAKAKEIISFLEDSRFDLSWSVYSLDEWIVKDKSDPRIIEEERNVKAEAKEGTADSAKGDEINKILCICNPETILETEEKVKAVFPGFYIIKSSDTLLEIMESGISKATAVTKLCNLLNIPVENSIAFGDNYNDLEMLETAGRGFLMDNAPLELKERIKLHTADNDHDGIYYALLEAGII